MPTLMVTTVAHRRHHHHGPHSSPPPRPTVVITTAALAHHYRGPQSSSPPRPSLVATTAALARHHHRGPQSSPPPRPSLVITTAALARRHHRGPHSSPLQPTLITNAATCQLMRILMQICCLLFESCGDQRGLLLLFFAAMEEKENMSSLFVAAVFIALGRSGRDISLKQFLEDQCKAEWPVDGAEGDEVKIHQDKECWRIASVLGILVSICVSWIYKNIKWVVLCKISVIAMGLGFGFFLAGIPFYHVINLPRHISNRYGVRCINKDVIVEAFSRVEVKKMFSMTPLWTTFLAYGLLQATASVFFYEQFNYMNSQIGHISNVPVVIFAVIIKSTSFGVSYICEKWFQSNFREEIPRYILLIRIGVGLAIAPVCCIVAWRVESYRLEKHVKYGISTSVAWLIPQFVLLGILDGLVSDGTEDFFNANINILKIKYGRSLAQFAPSMGHFISLALVLNLGSLFGDSLDTSRLGLYYVILGYVCFVNFMFYCFVATYFVKRK